MEEVSPTDPTISELVEQVGGIGKHPTVNVSGLKVVVLAQADNGHFEGLWHGLLVNIAPRNRAILITDPNERLFSLEQAVDGLHCLLRKATSKSD